LSCSGLPSAAAVDTPAALK